jgi:hypothetical protein
MGKSSSSNSRKSCAFERASATQARSSVAGWRGTTRRAMAAI